MTFQYGMPRGRTGRKADYHLKSLSSWTTSWRLYFAALTSPKPYRITNCATSVRIRILEIFGRGYAARRVKGCSAPVMQLVITLRFDLSAYWVSSHGGLCHCSWAVANSHVRLLLYCPNTLLLPRGFDLLTRGRVRRYKSRLSFDHRAPSVEHPNSSHPATPT